jgi:hypothetical protein
MTTVFVSIHGDSQSISYGVEAYLVNYTRIHGCIVSLDQWARDIGITPWYARMCAHRAEQKGQLKLTRLALRVGHPYRVEFIGKEEIA